jgi:hypothetical protein
MTEAIDKIPAETRWAIATQGLTGATIAYAKALKDGIGEDKYNAFINAVWFEAGKGAKEFADNLGMASDNAGELEAVAELFANTAMGPECQFEIVEATADRCVGKATKCPWCERGKEMGLDFDLCSSGHQGWGEGVIEALNPSFKFSLTKNMVRGDAHCEWVIERKP